MCTRGAYAGQPMCTRGAYPGQPLCARGAYTGQPMCTRGAYAGKPMCTSGAADVHTRGAYAGQPMYVHMRGIRGAADAHPCNSLQVPNARTVPPFPPGASSERTTQGRSMLPAQEGVRAQRGPPSALSSAMGEYDGV
eukprot:64795-Prorocentrum_minimum.AAC.1